MSVLPEEPVIQRRYTIREIDAMRFMAKILHSWNRYEADDDQRIENLLRTYMMAGTTPEEMDVRRLEQFIRRSWDVRGLLDNTHPISERVEHGITLLVKFENELNDDPKRANSQLKKLLERALALSSEALTKIVEDLDTMSGQRRKSFV